MMDAPEVAFHRYFQRRLSRPQRQVFRGKADLFKLHEGDAKALSEIQSLVNQSLALAGPNYHFDYVDSDEVQAMAFAYGGYAFVGATMALIRNLFSVCLKLATSDEVVAALGLTGHAAAPDFLVGISARVQLTFIAAHEFAHHSHGEVPEGAEEFRLDEFGPDSGRGLTQQAHEVAADGYAIYLVLDSVLVREYREFALEELGLATATPDEQDRALLAVVTVALGAQFTALSPRRVDEPTIYELTHPPPPARMYFVMQHAILWAEQYRPRLSEWITPQMFAPLMRSAAYAVLQSEHANWDAQVAFLSSAAGKRYTDELARAVNRYKSQL